MVPGAFEIATPQSVCSLQRTIPEEQYFRKLVRFTFLGHVLLKIERVSRHIEMHILCEHVVTISMKEKVANFMKHRKPARFHRMISIDLDPKPIPRESITNQSAGHSFRKTNLLHFKAEFFSQGFD